MTKHLGKKRARQEYVNFVQGNTAYQVIVTSAGTVLANTGYEALKELGNCGIKKEGDIRLNYLLSAHSEACYPELFEFMANHLRNKIEEAV